MKSSFKLFNLNRFYLTCFLAVVYQLLHYLYLYNSSYGIVLYIVGVLIWIVVLYVVLSIFSYFVKPYNGGDFGI